MTDDLGPESGTREVEDLIESYLDELLLALRGRPREARRLLVEVEAHLRETVEAGIAAGRDRLGATEEALRRFGPPAAVARGLPSQGGYRSLLAQMGETVVLATGLLFLAAGAAAVPAAIVGLAGNVDLVTGDRPGWTPGPERCRQLVSMTGVPDCVRALGAHHLQEVLRDHLMGGVAGFVLLVAWWLMHVRHTRRPTVLPTGFGLSVCGPLLGVSGAVLLAAGVGEVTHHVAGTRLMGSGDLIATGATVLGVALLCWTALARQALRPARSLAAPT